MRRKIPNKSDFALNDNVIKDRNAYRYDLIMKSRKMIIYSNSQRHVGYSVGTVRN